MELNPFPLLQSVAETRGRCLRLSTQQLRTGQNCILSQFIGILRTICVITITFSFWAYFDPNFHIRSIVVHKAGPN